MTDLDTWHSKPVRDIGHPLIYCSWLGLAVEEGLKWGLPPSALGLSPEEDHAWDHFGETSHGATLSF